MTIRIGISGWRYEGWRGVFYPPGLVHHRELAYAARQFGTIEINGSHYSLQSIDSWRAWDEATPDGFVFAVKGPRYLTHHLRFRDERAGPGLANFFASGVLALGPKLGPFLWQFPPTYHFDAERFEHFLALLPPDTKTARTLAAGHDSRVTAPWYDAPGNAPLRHAIEIRHDSFVNPAFPALLRRYKAALVVSHAIADWPYAEDVTSDFVYIRLHGSDALYSGSYADKDLDHWARRVEAWSRGGEPPDPARIAPVAARKRASRDVFVYFDNDQKVKAPFDAQRLWAQLRE